MTLANTERVTYASKAAKYSLDPNKLFDVIAELAGYNHLSRRYDAEVNRDFARTSASFRGDGRKLSIITEVVNEPGFLTRFTLATLVLSEDGTKLTLQVHEHSKVAIDPNGLELIANTYQVK